MALKYMRDHCGGGGAERATDRFGRFALSPQ
jgi:hypothetical protein